MKLRTVIRLTLAAVVLVGGGAAYRWQRSQWIPAGYVGVIYDASGGLRKQVIPPRRVYVGWRQQLYVYPTMLRNAVYTQDPDEGEVKSADGILVTTSDNANTTFDVSVVYRVKPEDVVKVFQAFGPIPIEEIQANHLRRATREAVNAISTQYDVFELMGAKRELASQLTTEELRKRLAPKGITVEIAMIGSCYPSPEIGAKINQRVNSYTELAISDIRRQIAEIERSTALVSAQAEAQARELSASRTQERSIEMLRLQADEDAIARWNGQLPVAQARAGQTVFIDRDLMNLTRAQERGGRMDQ